MCNVPHCHPPWWFQHPCWRPILYLCQQLHITLRLFWYHLTCQPPNPQQRSYTALNLLHWHHSHWPLIPELHQLKTASSRLEWLYKKTGLTVHSQMYSDHLHHYKNALTTAKSSYYSNLINTGKGNNRVLFSTVGHLLQPPKTLPPNISTNQCTAFLDFFSSKINTIQQLASVASGVHLGWTPLANFSSAPSQKPVSEHTVSQLILKAKTTTCQLDPLPTSLVKACLPSISPMIINIINSSLTSGTKQPTLKLAAITPTLKKPSADPADLNHYWPISNLPLIYKTH